MKIPTISQAKTNGLPILSNQTQGWINILVEHLTFKQSAVIMESNQNGSCCQKGLLIS